MQLGWIDFSKNERNKVLNVIHLLDEPGAVDELGIGAIRDAFADYFFPGTSTVQTRAKYFLIVPYILKEAGTGMYGSDINTILRRIDNEERKCRDILIKTSSEGVIISGGFTALRVLCSFCYDWRLYIGTSHNDSNFWTARRKRNRNRKERN